MAEVQQEFLRRKRQEDREKTEVEINDLGENNKKLAFVVKKLQTNVKDGITEQGSRSIRRGIVQGGTRSIARSSQAVLGAGALAATNNILVSGLIAGTIGTIEKSLNKAFDFIGDISDRRKEKEQRDLAREEVRKRLNLTEEEFALLEKQKKQADQKAERDAKFQSFLQDKLGLQADIVQQIAEAQDRGDGFGLRDEQGRFTTVKKILGLPSEEEKREAQRKERRESGVTSEKEDSGNLPKNKMGNGLLKLITENPVLSGVIGLVAALTTSLAFTDNEKLKELGNKFSNTVVPILKGLGDFISDVTFPNILQLLSDSLDNLDEFRKDLEKAFEAENVMGTLAGIASSTIKFIINGIDNFVTAILRGWGFEFADGESYASTIKSKITVLVDKIMGTIDLIFMNVVDNIKRAMGFDVEERDKPKITKDSEEVENEIKELESRKQRILSGPGPGRNSEVIGDIDEKIKDAKKRRVDIINEEVTVTTKQLENLRSSETPDTRKIEKLEKRLDLLGDMRVSEGLSRSIVPNSNLTGGKLREKSQNIENKKNMNAFAFNQNQNINSTNANIQQGDMVNIKPRSGSTEPTFSRLARGR